MKEQFTECIDVAVDDTHYYAIIQEMHNIRTGRELFEYRKIALPIVILATDGRRFMTGDNLLSRQLT